MRLKQFKNKFKKSRHIIETELDRIIECTEELEDVELSNLVQEIVENTRLLIVENTDEELTDKRLADYFEYLEETTNFSNDEPQDEE
jgi:allophanate hydrolase subunit 1